MCCNSKYEFSMVLFYTLIASLTFIKIYLIWNGGSYELVG